MFALLGLLALPGTAQDGDKAAGPYRDYYVQPYYLYPKDQRHYPEYEKAVRDCVKEIQDFYKKHTGLSFRLAALKVIHCEESYERMKFGDSDKREGMPNWLNAVLKAIGGWKERQVAWVFAQGGGGWAGGNLQDDFRGYAIFGDWVLEPISGVENPDGIPARLATWQVKGGVPKGTTVHELGHGFGVHHPDNYEGKSLMKWHGDYPDVSFHPHEVMILKQSPFFTGEAGDSEGPYPSFATKDSAKWGERLVIPGKRFRGGDVVEFVTVEKTVEAKPEQVSEAEIVVVVPRDLGPGYLRVRRGKLASHGIPINLYPN
ncbi:MAG TPA: hypothetical protein VI643_01320 [Planctomycetota bacterium]|nr:hypothetical protein [Planctomycetota bacterium]